MGECKGGCNWDSDAGTCSTLPCHMFSDDSGMWVRSSKKCDLMDMCRWEGTNKKGSCLSYYKSPYYVNDAVPNCHDDTIIKDADTCKAAAMETGRTFTDLVSHTSDEWYNRPPGCYYQDGNVYYNEIPSDGSAMDWYKQRPSSSKGCDDLGGGDHGCLCAASRTDVKYWLKAERRANKKEPKQVLKAEKKLKKAMKKAAKQLKKKGYCTKLDGNGNTIDKGIKGSDMLGLGKGLVQSQESFDTYCECNGDSKCIGFLQTILDGLDELPIFQVELEFYEKKAEELAILIDTLENQPYGNEISNGKGGR